MVPAVWDDEKRAIHARAWHAGRAACEEFHAAQRQDELIETLMVAAYAVPEPKVIVEIGCDAGGTLYAWRSMFPAADVYGLTLPVNRVEDGGQGYQLNYHQARMVFGDSHDPAVLQRLKTKLGRRQVDVLFIDGDHSYRGARQDWDMYVPLVRRGGLVLVHDALNQTTPDVPRFWEDLKRELTETGAASAVSEVVSKSHYPVGFGIVRMAGGQ